MNHMQELKRFGGDQIFCNHFVIAPASYSPNKNFFMGDGYGRGFSLSIASFCAHPLLSYSTDFYNDVC